MRTTFARRIGKIHGSATILVAAVSLLVCGCGREDFENRQKIEGTVKIDGRPLEKALITFLPIGETKGPRSTGQITDGQYLIESERGPCPGEFKVMIEVISPEIEALAKKDYEALHRVAGQPSIRISPQYNRDTKLRATVQDGGENRFDCEVEQAPEETTGPKQNH